METGIRTDAQGVTIALPALWKSSVSKDGTLAYGIITSIVHNGNVLCAGGEKGGKPLGNQFFIMKNAETGEDLWRWDDKLTTFEGFTIQYPYQYDKYLVFQEGPRGYCIDLSNGQTIFKNSQGFDLGSSVTGIGNTYFLSGNTKESEAVGFAKDSWLWQGSIRRVDEKQIIQPPYSRKFIRQFPAGKFAGSMSPATPYIVGDDTLVVFGYYEFVAANDEAKQGYLSLYNLSQRKWVYDKKEAGFAGPILQISGDKVVYSGGRNLTCSRLSTGEILWNNREFGQDFGFSGFLIAEGKVIGNNEDTHMYALDLETGRTLWKEKSNGTGSRLAYLDGVVYLVAGGVLHAVEAATGRHLWRLKSPDLAVNQGAFFFGFVAAVPSKNGGKGKIIANTGLNAYCYEAAR